MNESGKTDHDMQQDAMNMYEHFEKSKFKLLHCYELLQKAAKWMNRCSAPKKRKRKVFEVKAADIEHLRDANNDDDYPEEEENADDDDVQGVSSGGGSSSPGGRPLGHKGSKETTSKIKNRAKKNRQRSRMLEEMAERNALMKSKQVLQERTADLEVLTKDLSGVRFVLVILCCIL